MMDQYRDYVADIQPFDDFNRSTSPTRMSVSGRSTSSSRGLLSDDVRSATSSGRMLLNDDARSTSSGRLSLNEDSRSVSSGRRQPVMLNLESRTFSPLIRSTPSTAASDDGASVGASVASELSSKEDNIRTYLNYVASCVKKNVMVMDRRQGVTTYKNCFVAQEAIDFLVSVTVAPSRAHGVLLCKHLATSLKLLEPVCEDNDEFKDDHIFFRFVGMHAMGNVAFTNVIRDSSEIGVEKSLSLPENWASDANNWDENLAKIAVILRDNVEVKDRRYRVSSFPSTFVGSEAIDAIMNAKTIAKDRTHAVDVLRMVNEKYRIFAHACRDHELKDEYLFYRFIDSKPKTPQMDPVEFDFFEKTDSPWKGMSAESLEVIVAELTHADDFSDKKLLAYNNMTIGGDGTVMSQQQIRDLRQRHGFCLTCPGDPTRLYVVKRSKFNPLYQKKEALTVPGKSLKGVCLRCSPEQGGGGGGGGGRARRRHSLSTVATVVKETNSMMPSPIHPAPSVNNISCNRSPRRMTITTGASNTSLMSSGSRDSRGTATTEESTRSGKSSGFPMRSPDQNIHDFQSKRLQSTRTDLGLPPTGGSGQRRGSDEGFSHLTQSNLTQQARDPEQPGARRRHSLSCHPSPSYPSPSLESPHARYLGGNRPAGNQSSFELPESSSGVRPGLERSDSEDTFKALHKRRHLLAQAQDTNDLHNMIGAIRQSRSRSPSPPSSDRPDRPNRGLRRSLSAMDLPNMQGLIVTMEEPIQRDSLSVGDADERTATSPLPDPEVLDCSMVNLDEDGVLLNEFAGGMLPPTKEEGEEDSSIESREDETEAKISVRAGTFDHSFATEKIDCLQDNLNNLAKTTDDRLCALEKQMSAMIEQQKQQSLLIQQNAEMLRRLLELGEQKASAQSSTPTYPDTHPKQERSGRSGKREKTSLEKAVDSVPANVGSEPRVKHRMSPSSRKFSLSPQRKTKSSSSSRQMYRQDSRKSSSNGAFTDPPQRSNSLPRQMTQREHSERMTGEGLQMQQQTPVNSGSGQMLGFLAQEQPTGQKSFDDIVDCPELDEAPDGGQTLTRQDESFSIPKDPLDESGRSIQSRSTDRRERKERHRSKKKRKKRERRRTGSVHSA